MTSAKTSSSARRLVPLALVAATLWGTWWYVVIHQQPDAPAPVAAASQGVNVARLRFLIYVAAAVGCGLAGAVYFMAQLRINPPSAFDPMWANVAIFIVMIGGIGSIRGALVASLLIGVVDTFGKALVPEVAGVLVYVAMALILLWKPDGLFRAG